MEDAPSRTRRFFQLAALTVLGTVMGLAGGELIARALWTAPSSPHRVKPQPGAAYLPDLRDVRVLRRPNVEGLFRGVLYRTNSAGFRGPEMPEEKPPGVFRVVVGGDSITMGFGVLEQEAYPALLAAALNARDGPYRYEVLNLGVAGIAIAAVVDRIEAVGLRFDPDLIVYGFTLNDVEGPAYRTFDRSVPLPFAQRRAERSPSYLWRVLWPHVQSLRELWWPPSDSHLYELGYNYFRNPAAIAALRHHLDRLARIGRERDVCVVVFVHTGLHYLNWLHPFRPLYRKVGDEADARGLRVVQSLPFFLGQDAPSLWVAKADPHPNAEGHALLAHALSSGLDELPAACWRRAESKRPGSGAGGR